MEFVVLGAIVAGVMTLLRRGRRRRSAAQVGEVGDDYLNTPSRLRDPKTGRVERGWL